MAAWQIRRVPQLEAGLLTNYVLPDAGHPLALSAEGFQQLSRLDRHQAALQRTFDRAMKELRAMQAERGGEEPDETADFADSTDLQNEATGVQAPPNVLVNQPGPSGAGAILAP